MQLFAEAIAFIPPADTELFIKVALAAKTLMPDDGIDVLLDWTKGTPQFDEVREVWGDCKPVSLDFVDEVFLIAESKGWQRTSIDAPLTKILSLTKSKNFSIKLPGIPSYSLVKVLYDDMLASSYSPLPPAILASALGAVGSLRGGLHETETGLRPNLYSMVVANSGTGKSIARDYIFSLFAEIGAGKYLMGEPQSAQGINSALKAQAFRFLYWEEIGLALKAIMSKNSSSYQQMIFKYLMELFSNKVAVGFEYADEKRSTTKIFNSCLSLVGIATGERLFQSFGSDFISDGLIPRFLFWDTGNLLPEKDFLKTKKISLELRDRASALANTFRSEREVTIFNYEPAVLDIIAQMSKSAHSGSLEIIKNKEPDCLLAIKARTVEHAMKLALVVSDENSRIIREEDFIFGKAIAEQNERYLIKHFLDRVADSQNKNPDQEMILRFINQEKQVRHSALFQKFRRKDLDLKRIINSLIEAGDIVQSQEHSVGRPAVVYFPAK